MKIVFMGTPALAAAVLEALTDAGYNVSLAVTQPDRPKGRGRGVVMTPVKETALSHGIEVFAPEKVKTKEAVLRLRQEEPDLIIAAAYGQILSREILDIPRLGCINVHASLLPKYRGAAPIQWAVINGDPVSGVTIMRMEEGLDTGAVYSQREIPLEPGETGDSLYAKMGKAGGELLVETLPSIEAGTIQPQPQADELATFAPMLSREMGNLDWDRPAEELERLVRGLNSWPGAYTFYGGKMLKIWESTILADSSRAVAKEEYPAGTIVGTDKETIFVQCGKGVLGIKEVQLEGKKRMPVQAFLLGVRLKEGERFCRERA